MWRPLPAVAAAVCVGLLAATAAGVWLTRRDAGVQLRAGTTRQAATVTPASSLAQAETAQVTPAATPTGTPTPAATGAAPAPATAAPPSLAARAGGAAVAGGPAHFATLPPGASLPSSAQCAGWVRALPFPESKRVNGPFNEATGHALAGDFFTGDDSRAAGQLAPRVDGAFTGTTRQVLRWAACKWGVDEDVVYAQAAKESWWRQTTLGDYGGDPAACPPDHAPGADGQAGQCPQSYGILQNRFPYERSSWPGIARSTAMNADTAYAIWRACFEGYEQWLNTVDRGRAYAAGDAWGCVGRWFAGRWHTSPADQYAGAVQGYLAQRIWEQPSFQEP
jgi:hypothetical protein